MKKMMIVFALTFSVFAFNACNQNAKQNQPAEQTGEKKVYTCPMHPEVVNDKEANCPKCGMALVEKENADSSVTK